MRAIREIKGHAKLIPAYRLLVFCNTRIAQELTFGISTASFDARHGYAMTGNNIDSMTTLVDALYDQFLLRDWFGKIVPGSIFLVGIGLLINPKHFESCSSTLSTFAWFVLLGIAWVSGIAMQRAAECVGMGSYPKKEFNCPAESKDEQFYQKLVQFYAKASKEHKKRAERFAVIAEASGNTAAALGIILLLAVVLLVLKRWCPNIASA
ncbi:MAG: hypothetical protein ACE5G1_17775, partial [bacterium]